MALSLTVKKPCEKVWMVKLNPYYLDERSKSVGTYLKSIDQGDYYEFPLEPSSYYILHENCKHTGGKRFYTVYYTEKDEVRPIIRLEKGDGNKADFKWLDNKVVDNDKIKETIELAKRYYASYVGKGGTYKEVMGEVARHLYKSKILVSGKKTEADKELKNILLGVVSKKESKEKANDIIKSFVQEKSIKEKTESKHEAHTTSPVSKSSNIGNILLKAMEDYEKVYNEKLSRVLDKLVFVQVVAFDQPSEYMNSRRETKTDKDRVVEEIMFKLKPEDISMLRTLRKNFYDELHHIAVRTKIGWILFSDPKKHENLQKIIEAMNKIVKTRRAVELVPMALPRDFIIQEAKQYLNELRARQKYVIDKIAKETDKRKKYFLERRYHNYEAIINSLKRRIEALEKEGLKEIVAEKNTGKNKLKNRSRKETTAVES